MKYTHLSEQFETMPAMPLFEIAMISNNYLLVDLSIRYKTSKSGSIYPVGTNFSFDQRHPESPYNELPVSFDGCITGKHGFYFYPFDECFSLDEHLQEIHSNIVEGFLIPNELYSFDE